MRERNKILILSSFFPPQLEIAAIRMKSIIKYLNKLGWEVFCLNTVKSSEDYQDEYISRENIIVSENRLNRIRGKFKKDNKSFLEMNQDEQTSQISLGTKLKLYIKIFYKIFSLFLWVICSYVKLRKVIKKNKVSKVLCTVPSIDMLILGAFIKKLHPEVELIEEIRDVIFCNQIYNKELAIPEQKLYYFLEKSCIKYVDKFIFLTDNIQKIYSEEFNIKDKNIVITNGYDPDNYYDVQYIKQEKCIISHFGSFYGSRHPLAFIQAVGELVNEKNLNIHVNLVGKFQTKDIEQKALQLIEQYNILNDVTLISSLEHNEVIELEQKSDLNLIITHESGESNYALPGKVFEYIGAKRPIFCISSDELLCDMVNKYQLGYLVKQNEKDSIKETLEKVYVDWSTNMLSTNYDEKSFKKFNRRELTDKLSDFIAL